MAVVLSERDDGRAGGKPDEPANRFCAPTQRPTAPNAGFNFRIEYHNQAYFKKDDSNTATAAAHPRVVHMANVLYHSTNKSAGPTRRLIPEARLIDATAPILTVCATPANVIMRQRLVHRQHTPQQ